MIPSELQNSLYCRVKDYFVSVCSTISNERVDGDIVFFDLKILNGVKYHVAVLPHDASFDTLKEVTIRLDRLGSDVKTLLFHCLDRNEDVIALSQFNVVLMNHQRLTYFEDQRHRNPNYRHIQLHAHNENAFLDYQSRGLSRDTFLQATGTGKSYLVAAIAQDRYPNKIVAISSSVHILDQQKGIIKDSANVTYMTYSYLTTSTDNAIKDAQGVDCLVLDEFHRAGADNWQIGVGIIIEQLLPTKIVGTTATPIRHLDSERDMTKELFEGNVCHSLSLTDAIARGILRSPRYVSGLYEIKSTADAYRKKVASKNISEEDKALLYKEITYMEFQWERVGGVADILSRHMKSDDEKFLMFGQDTAHLMEMRTLLFKWLHEVTTKKINFYIITHRSRKQDVAQLLNDFSNFKKGEIHIIATVEMLNEGRHIKGIDGAFLFRKTTSLNLFYQQIGRVFDAGAKKSPLILDLVGNVNSVHSLLFSTELMEAWGKSNGQRDAIGFERTPYEGYIKDYIDIPMRKISEIDGMLGQIVVPMDEKVSLIERYIQEEGIPFIRQGLIYRDQEIYLYANKIRTAYNTGALSFDHEGRLRALGFVFDYVQSLSDHALKGIADFKLTHGHLDMPMEYEFKGVTLRTWISQERTKYRKGIIDPKVLKALKNLGVSLSPLSESEEKYLNCLQKYITEYGNANVPSKYVDGDCELGQWCVKQRGYHKKGILSQERHSRLVELGFVFDKKSFELDQKLCLLESFYRDNGHIKVPKGHKVEGINLYSALVVLRDRVRNDRANMSDECVERLKQIGFKLGKPKGRPEDAIKDLQHYVETHGSLSGLSTNNTRLADRYYRLKRNQKAGKLSSEVSKQLDEFDYS